MNESNAEEMIDPRVAEREKMESELKKLNENMEKLSKQVDEIQEELDKKNKPDKLGWDDVVQYGIGNIANFSLGQYISATIIVSTFAVIGAIAVDLVK
ncbi:MAG TPA: hypothetical protein HA300_01705 [Thermococcaceae archaeon]|nr:hypothetical protein [Thermococcaceae archaeon]